MLQVVSKSPRHELAVGALLAEPGSDDPLLNFAGPVAGSHALVIAPNGLDLMCRLLRHGCAAATTLRLAERPDHEEYDLVLAPSLVSSAAIGRLIYQAKRALVPTGRFLAFIPAAAAAAERDLAGMLVRSLRLGGFVIVQTRQQTDGLMVRADLPMHGLSHAMPRLVGRQA